MITFREGYDGNEPTEIVNGRKRLKRTHDHRFALALNTYYPSVSGGYYLNRSLIGLVQETLGELGLLVVLEDVYDPDGIVPVEMPGSLEEETNYAIVTEHVPEVEGWLTLWAYHAGGGGAFYEDRFILDFLLSLPVMTRFVERLRSRCLHLNVQFCELEPGEGVAQ